MALSDQELVDALAVFFSIGATVIDRKLLASTELMAE